MGRPATAIVLTPADRATLTQRLRAPDAVYLAVAQYGTTVISRDDE